MRRGRRRKAAGGGVDFCSLGLLRVDFAGSGLPVRKVKREYAGAFKRFGKQLRRGYRFKSDRLVSKGRLDAVDNHVTSEGVPLFHDYADNPGFPGRLSPEDVCRRAGAVAEAYGFERMNNIIVVGNGGSVNTTRAFYEALKWSYGRGKKVVIVDSMDPDKIAAVKGECIPEESIVVPISKSGNTQGVLDAYHQFREYPVAAVTNAGDGNRLYQAVKKVLDERGLGGRAGELVLPHPPIGGRFAGLTATGLFPMALWGLSVSGLRALEEGARVVYEGVGADVDVEFNPALRLAASLNYYDTRKGRDIIFSPMYSDRFAGFGTLFTQLLHESACKAGVGETILTASGPDCQHHTNQRLFGGKKDMVVVFFTVGGEETGGLEAGDGVPLEKALRFEYAGTCCDATEHGIPNFTVEVDRMDARAAGALLAFAQYAFGVYPSLLLDNNPFDQPQVERSKEIARDMRGGV